MPADPTNILILKPSALGDIVHALPVLSALRTALPTARITWLVRREFAPLLECVDGLDEILLFDRQQLGRWFYQPAAANALRQFLRTLRTNRYDLVLDLQGLFRTAFFARITGCDRRFGMAEAREGAALFYTHKVPRPDASLYVLDYYCAVMKAAGIQSHHDCRTRFRVPPQAAASLQAKLSRAGNGSKYLVLIPSSAHTSKCWPPERFAALADILHRQFGLDIVLTGTRQDQPIAEAIKSRCQVPLIDLVGQTSIPELIALLQAARGVISNDTGPGHIGLAMDIPIVLIFGHTNPLRVVPADKFACIAAVDPHHRPATIESTNPAYRIEHVSVELVLDKITEQLKLQPPRKPT